MRIHSLLQRGLTPCALALATMLGSASCNEADGTDPWPGAYPPEAEIDRPKGGGMDAGRMDAASDEDAGADSDAEPTDDAAPTTSDAAPDANGDAASSGDGDVEAGASDAASEAG